MRVVLLSTYGRLQESSVENIANCTGMGMGYDNDAKLPINLNKHVLLVRESVTIHTRILVYTTCTPELL